MTSTNLFTPSATTQSQTTLGANTDSAPQTEGQALYQQASQNPQPEAVVKRQFEQRNRDQKTQLANEFIASAGRQGINDLTATPDGQHTLAVVYEHAGDEARDLVRQVHEEQGNTAVDYSGQQGDELVDPLGVSDTGVKIGPQINGLQYTAMTAGVAYGLVENTVMGLVDMGKTVCKESEGLKNVDNLEFLDIDSTGQKSDAPGLSLPSWEDIGAGLKRNIQATNEAIATAKQQGSYFAVGKAISNDPLLQMTGLGDMAIFGSLARMRKMAKLESLATDTPRRLGGSAEAAGDGKLSSIDGNMVSEAGGGVGANSLSHASVRSEIVGSDSTLIKGAAFRHQTKWSPNAAGPRSVDDALRLADDYGVYIANDVNIRFVDDAFYDRQFGKFGDSYASYGHIEVGSPNQQLTWRSTLADKDGNVNIYVRNSVLDSDESILAVLHHETHEVEALRDIFTKRVSLSARDYSHLINDSTPGNLHWEAVDVGDQAVWQFRQDRGL